jgi:hypothetical protein
MPSCLELASQYERPALPSASTVSGLIRPASRAEASGHNGLLACSSQQINRKRRTRRPEASMSEQGRPDTRDLNRTASQSHTSTPRSTLPTITQPISLEPAQLSTADFSVQCSSWGRSGAVRFQGSRLARHPGMAVVVAGAVQRRHREIGGHDGAHVQ